MNRIDIIILIESEIIITLEIQKLESSAMFKL